MCEKEIRIGDVLATVTYVKEYINGEEEVGISDGWCVSVKTIVFHLQEGSLIKGFKKEGDTDGILCVIYNSTNDKVGDIDIDCIIDISSIEEEIAHELNP